MLWSAPFVVDICENCSHPIRNMSRRKQANPKPLKVVPPGGSGREDLVTLADRENTNTDNFKEQDYDEELDDDDEFRPLVIDTEDGGDRTPSTQSRDKTLHILHHSKDMDLYRENNPSDTDDPPVSHEGTPLKSLAVSLTRCAVDGALEASLNATGGDDSSCHSSRVSSPALSITSRSATKPGRQSQPCKARRKTDKILPVDGEKYVCPVCKQVLLNNGELTKHIRSHNTNTPVAANTCTICSKVLSSQSSLDRHMLVHSGERPFKCKICNMAFTTNGNMHRHSRIHDKEIDGQSKFMLSKENGCSSRGKPKSRKLSSDADYAQHAPLAMSSSGKKRTPPGGSLLSIGVPPGDLKRKLDFDSYTSPCSKRRSPPNPSWVKVMMEGGGQSMSTPTLLPSPITVLEGRLPHHKEEEDDDEGDDVDDDVDDGDDEDDDVSEEMKEPHCPVCKKTFLSQYGLDTHLQEDPTCKLHSQLSSGLSYREDILNPYSPFSDPRRPKAYHDVTPSGGENGVSSSSSSSSSHGVQPDVPVGFHELTFVDFTCEKFPLVSQAWCDSNTRRASSVYHDFTCRVCEKAFPCQTALTIHENSHGPENLNHCRLCDANFEHVDAYKDHMMCEHVGKTVISRCVNKANKLSEDDRSDPQDLISKEEFLACMNLRVKKDKSKVNDQMDCDEETSTPIKRCEELKDNMSYFKTLYQMSMPLKNGCSRAGSHFMVPKTGSEGRLPKPGSGRDSGEGHDFADIQQIITRFGSGGSLMHINSPSLKPMPKLHPILQPSPSQQAQAHSQPPALTAMAPRPEPSRHGPGTAKSSRILNPSGMKLPVVVPNGLVPILPKTDRDESQGNNNSTEVRKCCYCPEVFNNSRSYKGHVRSHLGLSPYKCNLCPYSSADKSTLIRHLRTHNGERPFQCRVCEFAFTTKANCERHVRKKHSMNSKKEIEDSIGYNQFVNDTTQDLDSFASPDTVCKYCGEDFKFFRVLKHHLRSHSSCRHKPFLCKICNNGFSTKANCVRHVQKQHPEIDQRHLEDHIHTNELLVEAAAAEVKMLEGMDLDQSFSSVLSSSSGSCQQGAYPHGALMKISPISSVTSPRMTPPPGTPPPSTSLQTVRATTGGSTGGRMLMSTLASASGTYITSPPIIALKRPTSNTQDDQPLDFSMKKSNRPPTVVEIKPEIEDGIPSVSGDEPMDLSVRKATGSMVAHQVTAPPLDVATRPLPLVGQSPGTPDYGMLRYKKEYQKFYNPTVGRLQCPYCKMLFKHGLKLQVHIRSHTNERPFSCFYCSASFTIKTNLERHFKTRHPTKPSYVPDDAVTMTTDDVEKQDENEAVERKEIFSSKPLLPRTLVDSPRNNFGTASDDSNCELSSVTKILDTTHAAHFPAFFAVNSHESPVEQVSFKQTPFEAYRDGQQADVTQTGFRDEQQADVTQTGFRDVQQSDVTQTGFRDGQQSDVTQTGFRDMPQADVTQTPFEVYRHGQLVDDVDSGSDVQDDDGAESEADVRKHVTGADDDDEADARSDVGQSITTGVSDKGPNPGEAGGNSPAVKKKRNSYADSPHKLVCPYCPRAFPWISSLNRHILTHTGQKPFKCPQCSVMFSTKSNRERHLVRKHGLNVLDPATRQMMDRPFKCHLCVFSSFSTAGNLIKHYHEKHPEQTIPEHLKQASDSDSNNNNDSYTTECQENTYASQISEAKRLQLQYEDDEDEDKDVLQDGLGQKLIDHVHQQPPVKVEMSHRNPGPYPATPRTSPTTSPPGTPDRQQINPERDNYNVDKITECWKCDEEFSSRKVLLRHLKEHSIDLAYKCYLCDASFDGRGECLHHKATRHPNDWVILREKNQVVDIDDFTDCMNRIVEQNFIGNNNYGKKVTEAEVARYKVHLSDDMKPESDYTQRKVYCSLCPKRFWSLQDLRRHMRSHTGERPFECDICQKRFTLKHSMMRHRRKHVEPGIGSLSASEDESSHISDLTTGAGLHSLNAVSGWEATLSTHRRKQALPTSTLPTNGRDPVSTVSDQTAEMSSDLLNNLLGVEISEEMFSSPDSAARLLGLRQ